MCSVALSFMFCSKRGCNSQHNGKSLATLCGITYNGTDGQVFFCDKHFPKMYGRYSTYKGLEKSNGCGILSRGVNLNFFHNATLEEWEVLLGIVIQLRSAFQEKLKSHGQGHLFWFEHLVTLHERVKTILEDRSNGEWLKCKTSSKCR